MSGIRHCSIFYQSLTHQPTVAWQAGIVWGRKEQKLKWDKVGNAQGTRPWRWAMGKFEFQNQRNVLWIATVPPTDHVPHEGKLPVQLCGCQRNLNRSQRGVIAYPLSEHFIPILLTTLVCLHGTRRSTSHFGKTEC